MTSKSYLEERTIVGRDGAKSEIILNASALSWVFVSPREMITNRADPVVSWLPISENEENVSTGIDRAD